MYVELATGDSFDLYNFIICLRGSQVPKCPSVPAARCAASAQPCEHTWYDDVNIYYILTELSYSL